MITLNCIYVTLYLYKNMFTVSIVRIKYARSTIGYSEAPSLALLALFLFLYLVEARRCCWGMPKPRSSQKGNQFLLVPFGLSVSYYWFPSRREPPSPNLKSRKRESLRNSWGIPGERRAWALLTVSQNSHLPKKNWNISADRKGRLNSYYPVVVRGYARTGKQN